MIRFLGRGFGFGFRVGGEGGGTVYCFLLKGNGIKGVGWIEGAVGVQQSRLELRVCISCCVLRFFR